MAELNINLIQYRNAVYQGGFNKGRREGKGILVTDSGEVFVGTWKNDNLNDKALIWLNEKTYVIGDFNRGLMDGQFIYRDNKSLFFAEFSNNKLSGKLIYIEDLGKDKKVRCYEYKNLNYREVLERTFSRGDQKYIFKEFLGYDDVELPELKDFIKNEMLKDGTYSESILPMGHTYIGFNKGDTVERVGFTYSKDELVSYGVYTEKRLDGIGFKFENGTKYQGMFKGGLLNGFGLKYQSQQNKYTFGYYEKGALKELTDIGDAEENSVPNMILMKKKMHIQSVYFFNSFVKATSMLKYRGYQQTLFKSNKSQKQYMFPQAGTTSRSKLRSNEQYPIIRKINSDRRGQEQDRQYLTKVGPSKVTQSTQKLTALGSRKVIDRDPDFNPERELRGSHAILNKMQKVQSSRTREDLEYGSSPRQQRPYGYK